MLLLPSVRVITCVHCGFDELLKIFSCQCYQVTHLPPGHWATFARFMAYIARHKQPSIFQNYATTQMALHEVGCCLCFC